MSSGTVRNNNVASSPISPLVELNILPTEFSANSITGFMVSYHDADQLKLLQKEYSGKILFKRKRHQICGVPLLAGDTPTDSTPCTFSSYDDWSIFERLLENGVRELLRVKYPTVHVPMSGRVQFSIRGERRDLVRDALASQPNLLAKLNFIHIYRKYEIFCSHVKDRDQALIQYGVGVRIGTDWQLNASIKELSARGVDCTGCYIVPLNYNQDLEEIGNKSIGSVSKLLGNDLFLADFRDKDIVDANEYTLVASLENVTRCITAISRYDAKSALGLIRSQVGQLLHADGQIKRIQTMAEILSQQPIQCAAELYAKISEKLAQAGPNEIIPSGILEQPKYVVHYGHTVASTSIATTIASQGPFDQDGFKKTSPYILLITPKRYQGRAEQFLRTWRDGGLRSPYSKGFVEQYRLRGCDFHIVDFEETSGQIDIDYHQACLRALQESRDIVRRYDLAFVVTRENHRLMGSNDPYLVCKAALMNDGVPVQAVEIETIDLPVDQHPFILNNLALASYAKLGGTPWLLSSPKGQGITHELIIGLGSTSLLTNTLWKRDRYIGITALFNYDGVYLLSNISKEAEYENYSKVLEDALLSSVQLISVQKGWQPGDRVRLIFHTFKPLRNIEIEAAKQLVMKGLPGYEVDFAFLVIGQYHGWRVYDQNSPGRINQRGQVIGLHAPQRGTLVILDENHALLAINGPTQLKAWYQGCPTPIQIILNGASTFRDIEYLARQVFEFTYMSWKTYNLLPMPITITYSEAIAHLLGRLRHIRNWNSDVFRTTQLGSTLWFL